MKCKHIIKARYRKGKPPKFYCTLCRKKHIPKIKLLSRRGE